MHGTMLRRGGRWGRAALVAAGVALAAPLAAGLAAAPASAETVADIREELTILNGQIQQIRDELASTGAAAGLPREPATALQRLDQLEAALRRLTNRVDVLTSDIDRIVRDASNRVGDLEFRLTELEGGDVGLVGQGEPLGGGLTAAAPAPPAPAAAPDAAAPSAAAPSATEPSATEPSASPPPFAVPTFEVPPAGAAPADAPQLAVAEQADFDAAKAALEAGEHARAAELFDGFLVAYPVGPLSGEAQFLKGEALAGQGDWRGAARNYLDAFSGAPDAPTAPNALYRLAVSLAELGQTEEACLTLTEVTIRYPGSEVAGDVAARRGDLACR